MPLNHTRVHLPANPDPRIVTIVPPELGPDEGAISVITGAHSTKCAPATAVIARESGSADTGCSLQPSIALAARRPTPTVACVSCICILLVTLDCEATVPWESSQSPLDPPRQ